MEIIKKYFIILFLLALAIFISGCIGLLTTPGEDSIAPGKGRLEIYLTDAPGDYLEVNITISKIEAHIAGEDKGTKGYWIVLRDWSDETESELPVFDLINLKDVYELLVDGVFEIGKYTQLRVFVTKFSIKVEIEDTVEENTKEIDVVNEVPFEIFNVEIPINLQTGLKLIHPFEIIENGTTELIIDFDAEKSVVKTDNGEYILKPVIKVTSSTTINNTTPVN